jgi:hypothetical protein
VKQSPSRKRGELQRDAIATPELRRQVEEQQREVEQVREQAAEVRRPV